MFPCSFKQEYVLNAVVEDITVPQANVLMQKNIFLIT